MKTGREKEEEWPREKLNKAERGEGINFQRRETTQRTLPKS